MGKIRQFYGIKFPFTTNNNDNHVIDMNNNPDDKIASEIAHLILTQKRTRLKMPDYGTNLITFIFDQNDSNVWSDIENDIMKSVTKYIPNASINKVSVYRDENNDNAAFVSIEYSSIINGVRENNKMVLKV